MKGTVTFWPETAESCTVAVSVPTLSAPLWLAMVNCTVGAASLSVIVAVWTVVAPAVALVGAPIVTTTVSSASSRASSTTAMLIVPVVAPARMVIGLAVMV